MRVVVGGRWRVVSVLLPWGRLLRLPPQNYISIRKQPRKENESTHLHGDNLTSHTSYTTYPPACPECRNWSSTQTPTQ